MLESSEGVLSVKLHFFVDEEGIRQLEGCAQTTVTLICQRCLEPMEYNVEADFSVSFAFHEDMARSMTGRYDPIVLSPDKRVSLVELIEDDLLLSLPMFSSHSDGECQVKTVYADQNRAVEAGNDQKKSNPFSVLANLKKPE
ncbi:YceD family protein [Gynuella sunshinyii]|nr:YceD family protein [Gynuella sunshinyii]